MMSSQPAGGLDSSRKRGCWPPAVTMARTSVLDAARFFSQVLVHVRAFEQKNWDLYWHGYSVASPPRAWFSSGPPQNPSRESQPRGSPEMDQDFLPPKESCVVPLPPLLYTGHAPTSTTLDNTTPHRTSTRSRPDRFATCFTTRTNKRLGKDNRACTVLLQLGHKLRRRASRVGLRLCPPSRTTKSKSPRQAGRRGRHTRHFITDIKARLSTRLVPVKKKTHAHTPFGHPV